MDAETATDRIAELLAEAGWGISPRLQEALFEEMNHSLIETEKFLEALAYTGSHIEDDLGFNAEDKSMSVEEWDV